MRTFSCHTSIYSYGFSLNCLYFCKQYLCPWNELVPSKIELVKKHQHEHYVRNIVFLTSNRLRNSRERAFSSLVRLAAHTHTHKGMSLRVVMSQRRRDVCASQPFEVLPRAALPLGALSSRCTRSGIWWTLELWRRW